MASAAAELWSESRGGIGRGTTAYGTPTLNPTALPNCTAEDFPLARIRGRLKCHEIEFGDWSSFGDEGLLPKASLERGGHLSMHHALRDTNATGGKVRPLGRMVSPV